jgi:hypothetical protein
MVCLKRSQQKNLKGYEEFHTQTKARYDYLLATNLRLDYMNGNYNSRE